MPANPGENSETLLVILAERGLRLRKHLEEVSWTVRKPTVVDLEPHEQRVLAERGLGALQALLAESGS